jgi:DNA-binding transcriptional regulator of glucitol operon
LVLYWDIHAFPSLAPDKADSDNDRSVSQWNGKGKFAEDAYSIVAFVSQQQIKRRQYFHGL